MYSRHSLGFLANSVLTRMLRAAALQRAANLPEPGPRVMVLTNVNQLWRADITYFRLRENFALLAVILDAYSRREIGWALDRTLEDELTLVALRMALSRRYRIALRRVWLLGCARIPELRSWHSLRNPGVKTFLGTSANAVKTQIWTAVIAMLIFEIN